MKVNFDAVKVYTSLDKKEGKIEKMRKDFADLIYSQGCGIEAHALALKIYNGDKETEYSDKEVEMIRAFSKICAPCIIDAFETILNNRSNDQDNK